jgi:uncharacterized protein YgbK (DUF1537 family)
VNPSAPRALPRPIRILSDDLTGALDTAAMLAVRGPIPVRLDRPAEADDAPVSVVSTGTRDVDPATLAARLAPSLRWLRQAAVPFRKVDSLLRGNSLAEVVATARGAGLRRVLFAPAFPAQGRFTVGARLLLGAPYRPDDASPAPAPGPLGEAFAALGVGSLAGAAALAALDGTGPGGASPRSGPIVLIPDVRTDGDLEALVERALAFNDELLWCGSAGLAQAIARLDAAPGSLRTETDAPAGRGLLVTASRHAALRSQLARLRALGADGAVDAVDLAPADPMPPEAAAEHLARGAARLVAARARPDWLAVVGGDTLLALCRAAGVEALSAGPAPRPGWGRATLAGGPWSGLACFSRSGAFGAPDDLLWLARATRPGPCPTLERTTR